ncbi:VOC family protein [Streptomyces muensis]|uniref:VOC family protein n=1 Tax=Streptomyces muensis TaxID=1077944 RepID=A0A9X1PS97_STRM4|nr:VOC family protein [Streptomyces muensis]MCF1592562.1 VOC family protein [Streptomyces muensis]
MRGLYHVGFAVPDIEAARGAVGRALSVEFGPPRPRQIGDWAIWVALSIEGPPFLELIEGPADSPWAAPDGSRFDHLGFWSARLADDRDMLAARGCRILLDGLKAGLPMSFHEVPELGARIEVVDASAARAPLLADRIVIDPLTTTLSLGEAPGV